jgi:hypothetical protein
LKKRGGSREKGGGGNEIHAPCACDTDEVWWSYGISQSCDECRIVVPYEISKVNFRVETKILVSISKEI